MIRVWLVAAAVALAPQLVQAQKDTTHHDSSVVDRKAKNTVNNAGEGVKNANDAVDNGAYKVGTNIKNVFRKPKKPAKPDTTIKRDSTPH
jgi:hypothetical protein